MAGSFRRALLAVAALIAALAASAGAATAAPRVDLPPILAATNAPQTTFGTLTKAARERVEAAATWGGPVTASTGETVTLFFSDSYPQDPALSQRWAEFFVQLVHGPELSRLRAYLLPLREVQSYCGRQALACYSPTSNTMVAPVEAPYPDTPAEGTIAHEYGHHIATYRNNAPWIAVDTGTKRWASYQQVCARTQRGELFPGDESINYRNNPGEAFAEAYRVLNERRLGLGESPWQIVTRTLQPDPTALTLLEQDVTQPWQGPTTASYKGMKGRVYGVATPLDGTMQVTLRAVGAKTRVQLVISHGAKVVARRTTAFGGSAATQALICGQRSTQVRVTRTAGTGAYTLAISKP